MANETALVGYSGFVGGNLKRRHRFDGLYNTQNIGDIAGKAYDVLVLSATDARRWWANLHPQEDKDGIDRLLSSLEGVAAGRVVLISTIDVLPQQFPDVDEDFDPCGHENHAYGSNRLYLEGALKERFGEVCVVRLPSLFGSGLKKNVIYDLLNGNQPEKINPLSSFQYYDLDVLWEHIELVMRDRLPVVHLFPAPVTCAEIIDRFFPEAEASCGGDAGPASRYAFRTKYSNLFGGPDGYLWSREEVFRRLGLFIERYRRGEIR